MSAMCSDRYLVGLVLAALFPHFSPLAHSQTNPIVNGGFESSGIVSGWQWFYNVGQANGFDSAYEGRNFAEVYGTLSQKIPVTPGQPYLLSFALSGNFNTPEDTVVEVYWAGDNLVKTVSWQPAGHNATNLGWIYVEVPVVGNARTNSLRFSNPHIGTQRIPKLDAVRLVPTHSFFVLTNTPFVHVRSGAMAWGDYDNDEDLDLVVTGNGSANQAATSLYQNNGDGTFSAANITLPGYRSGSVAWGDYDNDGYIDLLVTGISGNSTPGRVYRNFGGHGFGEVMSFGGVFDGGLSWGDFNNDGKLDFAVTGADFGAGPFTQVFQNYSGLYFGPLSTGIYQQFYGSVSWGDYDRDGDVDLLTTGSGTHEGAFVYRNQGINGFSPTRYFPFESEPGQWLDFDNDEWPDLVLQIWGYQQTRLYRNNRLGGFNLSANLSIGSYVAGDLNQDGWTDLLVERTLYENSSNGWTGVFVPMLAFDSAALGDFDRDGRLDIVACGQDSAPVTALYRNTLGPSNSAPTAPQFLDAASTPAGVVLSWSESDDAEQMSGLTYNIRLGTTPGGFDAISPMSAPTGFRRVVRAGNAGSLRRFLPQGLPLGQRYFWSVQAVDNSFAGSAFTPEQSFMVTTPPQISGLTNQFILEDSGPFVIPFTVADAESPATDISVYVVSSNQTLFPLSNVEVTGAGSARMLTLTPVLNQHGEATINVTATEFDGGVTMVQFKVTVLPVNDTPVAVLDVPALVTLGTNFFIIATNGSNALVFAHGAGSFDVDEQPLQFTWLRNGNIVGHGVEVTGSLNLGIHRLALLVSDGQLTATNSITFEVVNGCGAVRRIRKTVQAANLPRSRKTQLFARLYEACSFFNESRPARAIRHLEIFQRKVERFVAPLNAELAIQLTTDAETVIHSFRGTAENR